VFQFSSKIAVNAICKEETSFPKIRILIVSYRSLHIIASRRTLGAEMYLSFV